jgi:hypothetical protein
VGIDWTVRGKKTEVNDSASAPQRWPDAPMPPPVETSVPADPGFLPSQPARRAAESVMVRLIATAGIIGIGTAVGAVLAANDVAGWITALVVSALSVILAAVLWRSREL